MIKGLPLEKSLEIFRTNKLVLKESTDFDVGSIFKASIDLFASKNPKYKRTSEQVSKEQALQLELKLRRERLFKPTPLFTVLNKRDLTDSDEETLQNALSYFGLLYEVFIRVPSPSQLQFAWTDTLERKTKKSNEWGFECISFGYSTAVLAFNLSHKKLKLGQLEKARELAEKAWLSMSLVGSIIGETFKWSTFKGDFCEEMVQSLILYFKAHIPLILAYQCHYAEKSLFETNQAIRKRKIELWNCAYGLLNKAKFTFMYNSKLVSSCPTLRNSILFKREFVLFNYLLEKSKELKRIHRKEVATEKLDGSSCGLAVAHLALLVKSLESSLKENSKHLDKNEKELLKSMLGIAQKKHKQYMDWNNQVFKQNTSFQVEVENLFSTPASQKELLGIQASHSFQVFPGVPEDLIRTLRNFDLQKAAETEQTIEQIKAETMVESVKDRIDFEERIRKVCEELNIDMHTNHVQSPGKKEVSEGVLNKYKQLELAYGVKASKFFGLKSSLKEWTLRGVALKASILEKLEEQRKMVLEADPEFQELKKQAEETFQEMEKYTQKMAVQVIEFLDSEDVKKQIDKFLEGPESLMKKLPKTTDEKLVEFYNENPKLINDLISKKRKLDDYFEVFVKAQELFVANLKKINGRLIIGHLILNGVSTNKILEKFKQDAQAEVTLIQEKKVQLENYLKDLERICQRLAERMSPSQSSIFLTQSRLFNNEFTDFEVIMALPKKLSRLSAYCESAIVKALKLEGQLTHLIRESELRKDHGLEGAKNCEDYTWMDQRCSVQSVQDATLVESIMVDHEEYPTN